MPITITIAQDTKAGTYTLDSLDGTLTLTLDTPVSPSPPPPPPPPTTGVPPLSPQGTGAHAVVATVTMSNGETWIAEAHVGDDATVSAVYCSFVDATGNAHPGLTLWAYADCCEVGARRADNAYDYVNCKISVTYDGASVAVPPSSKGDGTVDFWCGCAMPAIRYGKQVGWDASKIDRSILPSYTSDPGSFDDSKKDYTFNGLGLATLSGMSSAGERNDIGYLPTWDVAFVTTPSDATWGVVRRGADFDGNWPVFFCDPATGGIINVETWPDANTLSKAQRSPKWNNPIAVYGGSYDGDTLTPPSSIWVTTKCPNVPNGAHLTRYAMLAAMITGTARDRDHASFWGNWPLLEINPAYRQSGGVMTGPIRRAAWCLASLFMAGYVSSDQAYFQRRTARQLEVANAIPTNQFGLMDTSLDYPGTGSAAGCKGIAIWQQNYMMETLDAVAFKLPEWRTFAQFVGGFYALIGSLPQAPLATIYFWVCHDASGNLIPDFMQQCRDSLVSNGWTDEEATAITASGLTIEDVYNQIVAHYAAQGKTWSGKLVNGVCDYIGSITASDSYPAGDIMATIAAHNVGTPNCDAAFARVQELPTEPTYGSNQKYHLVPRTA